MKTTKVILAILVFVLAVACYSCGTTRDFRFGQNTYQIRPTVPDHKDWLGTSIPFYQGENFSIVCWVAENPQNADEQIFVLVGLEKKALGDYTGYIIGVAHVPSMAAWERDKSAVFYYEDKGYIDDGKPSFDLSPVKSELNADRIGALIERKENPPNKI